MQLKLQLKNPMQLLLKNLRRKKLLAQSLQTIKVIDPSKSLIRQNSDEAAAENSDAAAAEKLDAAAA